jgi:hypothetical protein
MPPNLPDDEIGAARANFLAELEALSPQLHKSGHALLEKIATPNWALEWALPFWLGEAFALPPDTTRTLVMANVFLLGYERLADDLIDGDAAADALRLAVALHHLWVAQYVRLGASREFWRFFEEYLTQFLQGTLGSHDHVAASGEGDFFRHIAWRGASLKICCAAACLLGARPDALLDLATAVDQVMTGVVLLDDEFDWEQDLHSGRRNEFVAFCSPFPQTDEHRDANHLSVLRVIHDGTAARPYFDNIRARLHVAAESVRALGCKGLGTFIDWYDAEVAACGRYIEREASEELRALVAQTSVTHSTERRSRRCT